MIKTLRSALSRWEPRLWKAGLLGYSVRVLFRAVWVNINHIPSNEKLWRAVRKPDQLNKQTGRPKPSFFRDRTGLSCDLARFSTPEESRVGHGAEPYPPGSGLVEFTVSDVRGLPRLPPAQIDPIKKMEPAKDGQPPEVESDVVHRPTLDPNPNYAHSQLTTVLIGSPAEDLEKLVKYRIPPSF